MTVTKIEVLTNKKKKIHTDEETAFALYNGEVRKYELEEGREIPEPVYQELMTVLLKRAKLRSMHLLTKKDYSEHQLRTKLMQSDYPVEIIDQAVAYLYSFHYLDDERFARNFIEYRMRSKSRRQLIYELQQKGIPQDISAGVYDEISGDSEEEAIRMAIAKKRINPEQASREELYKLYAFLGRKGFSQEKIRKVIRSGDQSD